MTMTPDPNPPSAAVLDAVGEVVLTLVVEGRMDCPEGGSIAGLVAEMIDRLRRRGFDVGPMMGGGDA